MKAMLVLVTAMGLAAPALGASSSRARVTSGERADRAVAPFTLAPRSVDPEVASKIESLIRGDSIQFAGGGTAVLEVDAPLPSPIRRPSGLVIEPVGSEDGGEVEDRIEPVGPVKGPSGVAVELSGAKAAAAQANGAVITNPATEVSGSNEQGGEEQ